MSEKHGGDFLTHTVYCVYTGMLPCVQVVLETGRVLIRKLCFLTADIFIVCHHHH